MKKKILLCTMLITIILTMTACNTKKEDKPKESGEKLVQNIKDIKKDENGEIISGVIEGYKFEETKEIVVKFQK